MSLSLTKPMNPPPSLPVQVLRFLQWLEKTQGRDKAYRLIVYFSKWLVPTMISSGADPDLTLRIAAGASVVGTSRKLFRLFRSLEFYQEALISLSLADPVERFASIIKGFSLGMWLFFDHIQWLQKAGYLKLDRVKIKKIDEYHSKSWFYGLLFGVILCVYKLTKLAQQERSLRLELLREKERTGGYGVNQMRPQQELTDYHQRELLLIEAKKSKQVMGVVKNGLDLIIPSARLGWLNVTDATVGIAGTITSLIGIYDTYPSQSSAKNSSSAASSSAASASTAKQIK